MKRTPRGDPNNTNKMKKRMTEPVEEQKFYRTITQVEVLSDFPYSPEDLNEVSHDINRYGRLLWHVETISSEEVSREKMANLLEAKGSDPSFLLGDDEDEFDEKD